MHTSTHAHESDVAQVVHLCFYNLHYFVQILLVCTMHSADMCHTRPVRCKCMCHTCMAYQVQVHVVHCVCIYAQCSYSAEMAGRNGMITTDEDVMLL